MGRDATSKQRETGERDARTAAQAAGDFGAFGLTLADVQPKELRWLWPGYLLAGKLNGLVGDPDKGKSLLTLDIAARVTRGWAMPLAEDDAPKQAERGVVNPPGDVILLCAEDDPADTIVPRLQAAGADLHRVHLLTDYPTGATDEQGQPVTAFMNLGNATARDWLRQAIAAVDAKLIIADPLTAFLGTSAAMDANKEQDVRAAMSQLAQVLAETKCALWAIRHRSKDARRDPIYRSLGSIGFTAIFRSEWAVDEHPDDATRRVFNRLKCNMSAEQPALEFHIEATEQEAPHVVWDGASSYDARSLTSADQSFSPRPHILAFLRAMGEQGRGMTLPQLQEAVAPGDGSGEDGKKAYWRVQNVVNQLLKDGQVVRAARGVYTLPPYAERVRPGRALAA